jgi:16S rRNA (cytosine967-C5)-methyltransferase
MNALNQTAPVVLRTNTLKIAPFELQKNLAKNGWETLNVDNSPNNFGFYLKKRGNVFSTDAFKKGFFEVQDAGSQQIAPFLRVEAGMRVIDACAGAGGKSLHLATLMQNKGRIIALDIEDYKLEELKRRARRNGVGIIETRLIESSKTIKRLADSADRLLLDVPCSGLGVLRRNPDAKWKLQPEFIQKIRQTQQHILQNYTKMLKKGGYVVYATCSILPEENEQQVELFLKNNPNFKQLDQKILSPADANQDGFFMALLEKES